MGIYFTIERKKQELITEVGTLKDQNNYGLLFVATFSTNYSIHLTGMRTIFISQNFQSKHKTDLTKL